MGNLDIACSILPIRYRTPHSPNHCLIRTHLPSADTPQTAWGVPCPETRSHRHVSPLIGSLARPHRRRKRPPPGVQGPPHDCALGPCRLLFPLTTRPEPVCGHRGITRHGGRLTAEHLLRQGVHRHTACMQGAFALVPTWRLPHVLQQMAQPDPRRAVPPAALASVPQDPYCPTQR